MGIRTHDSVTLNNRLVLSFDEGTNTFSLKIDGTTLMSGTATAITLALANIMTFANAGLKIQDSNADAIVTISPGNESADRVLSIPVLGAADTIMTLGTAQTVSGVKTYSAINMESAGNALTAFAGGGQGSATALTKRLNFIGTCATAGDSVRLPTSVAGEWVFVYNGGAAAAQVFGASTDTINGVATATGVPLPANQGALFFCNAAGTWLAPTLRDAIPEAQYAAASNTTNFTATGAQVAGAQDVTLECTGALGSGQALTLPTAAAIVAALPNAYVGKTYKLRIINRSAGAFAWTVTTNTGLTLTGTMTIAQNTYRDFVVTLTSLSAIVFQSLGQVIVAA